MPVCVTGLEGRQGPSWETGVSSGSETGVGDQDGPQGTDRKAIMWRNQQGWLRAGLGGCEDGGTMTETGKAAEAKPAGEGSA